MRFLVLGAAAGGGLPQWNCGCQNCAMARSLDLRPQTQSSLAVSLDGLSWAFLNASPDIRQQINNNAQLYPRGLRDTPIISVVLTNGDLDHIAGLLTLRESQPFRIVLTGAIAGILDSNPVFRVLDQATVQRDLVVLNESFQLLPGLDDEMIRTRTGTKTGWRMGHMPISGEGGSLEVLARLDIGRIVYTHINNTNPIWRDGPERDLVLRHGFEVGCDGAEISLATRA